MEWNSLTEPWAPLSPSPVGTGRGEVIWGGPWRAGHESHFPRVARVDRAS